MDPHTHPDGPDCVGPDSRISEIDEALAEDDAQRAERRAARTAGQERLNDLPRLLRWIGGAVLVVAAFTFMLQSWESADDLARYYHFLAFTGVLTAAGFFCGLRIRDEKGARTFLGLAAGAVPIHFTVLGALLYSQFPWLSGFAHYPAYAHFTAPHPAAALATAAIGVVALVPVCWMAFLTLARPEAKRLTVAYMLANLTLLVPTRHPDVIGLLAFALLIGCLFFDRRYLLPAQGLRTLEGRFVRLLMGVPFAVLIGRTLNLYEPSSLFFAAWLASMAVTLFVLGPAMVKQKREAVLAQYVSLIPAGLACVALGDAVVGAFNLHESAILPLVCLPMAGTFAAMSLRTADGGARMRNLAALVAAGGMTAQLVFFPGVLSSVACLATAILATAYGYAAEQKGVLVSGAAALVFGLLYHLRYAAELYALSPWAALAALGIVTVVAASLLERHHGTLAAHVIELRSRIGGWSH
jgi:hypothetical protein